MVLPEAVFTAVGVGDFLVLQAGFCGKAGDFVVEILEPVEVIGGGQAVEPVGLLDGVVADDFGLGTAGACVVDRGIQGDFGEILDRAVEPALLVEIGIGRDEAIQRVPHEGKGVEALPFGARFAEGAAGKAALPQVPADGGSAGLVDVDHDAIRVVQPEVRHAPDQPLVRAS